MSCFAKRKVSQELRGELVSPDTVDLKHSPVKGPK